MKTQVTKRLAAGALLGAMVVLTVPAQAANIRAQVPFSFFVREKLLPPGRYTVAEQMSGALLITLTVLALNIGARIIGAERTAK